MKTKNLDEIKKIISGQRKYLASRFGVAKIGVFGSFAFGDFTPKSDIDILVEFKKSVGIFKFMELEEYLSEKLGRKVDLVSRDGLKKYIKKDILSSTIYA